MKDHTATLKQKVKKEFSHTATTVISEIEGHCENKEVGQYLRLTPLKCKVCPQMDYNHKWKNSAFVSPTVMMHLNFLNRNFSHTQKKNKNETSDYELMWLSVSCDCDAFVCGKRSGGNQLWNRLHNHLQHWNAFSDSGLYLPCTRQYEEI